MATEDDFCLNFATSLSSVVPAAASVASKSRRQEPVQAVVPPRDSSKELASSRPLAPARVSFSSGTNEDKSLGAKGAKSMKSARDRDADGRSTPSSAQPPNQTAAIEAAANKVFSKKPSTTTAVPALSKTGMTGAAPAPRAPAAAVAPTGSRRNPFPTAPVLTRVVDSSNSGGIAKQSPSGPSIVTYEYDADALDTTGPTGAEAFASLGLDARLVAKLVAARVTARASQPAPHADEDEDRAAAMAGITRGHLRDGFGLIKPTRVQRLVVPLATAGRSLVVKSETGSGKTLAFLLPVVAQLLEEASTDRADGGTRALVVAPTRELATQIFGVASRLVQAFPSIVPGLLCGGEKRKSEKARLRKGCALVVATPGRLLDHLLSTESFVCDSRTLRWLVLDEADRLLDLGFGAQIKKIVESISTRGAAGKGARGTDAAKPPRGTMLISATVTPAVRALAMDVLAADALFVDASLRGGEQGRGAPAASENKCEESSAVPTLAASHNADTAEGVPAPASTYSAPKTLAQVALIVPLKWRLVTLLAVLLQAALGGGVAGTGARAAKEPTAAGEPQRGTKMILFVSTCEAAELHAKILGLLLPRLIRARNKDRADKGSRPESSFKVSRLHGNVPQTERVAVFRTFSAAVDGLLIATDVAARGLDLPAVDLIVQADAPAETGDYVHRIGRTARRGARGAALLLLQPHESPYVELLRAAGLSVSLGDVSSALATLAAVRAPPLDVIGSKLARGDAPAAVPAAAAAPQRDFSGLDAKSFIGASQADIDTAVKVHEKAAAASAAASALAAAASKFTEAAAASCAPTAGAGRVGHLFRIATEMRSRSGLSASAGLAAGANGFSRVGEAFAVAWQTLLEELVESGLPAGSAPQSAQIRAPLLPLARRAFTTFVRAYATHERATRHIFHPRSLHLGHAAKAMGLREPPSRVAAAAARDDKAAKEEVEAAAGRAVAAPEGSRDAKRAAHKEAARRKRDWLESEATVDMSAPADALEVDGEPAPAVVAVKRMKTKPSRAPAISEFDA
jgi:superfamily II DNA/RNA helicase